MTQAEKLMARLLSLEPSSLYQIMVYVKPDGDLGFWIVERSDSKLEGQISEVPMPEKRVVV